MASLVFPLRTSHRNPLLRGLLPTLLPHEEPCSLHRAYLSHESESRLLPASISYLLATISLGRICLLGPTRSLLVIASGSNRQEKLSARRSLSNSNYPDSPGPDGAGFGPASSVRLCPGHFLTILH